jgi:hypothetical protein
VTLFSWLTIMPGYPQVYAPLNLLVLFPALMTSELFRGSYLIAVVLGNIFSSIQSLAATPVLTLIPADNRVCHAPAAIGRVKHAS